MDPLQTTPSTDPPILSPEIAPQADPSALQEPSPVDSAPRHDPEVPFPDPTSAASRSHSRAGRIAARQTFEFLVTLALSILLFRSFAAEAYVVPTGSMAPTLLGIHQEVTCPNCAIHFALGVDDRGQAGRALCPNCGFFDFERVSRVACYGDRLLVQKFLFDLRPPRRWEVAVFHSPAEPTQAYVKRVVGLPGESILISGGDIFVDGQAARKTLAEQRAMRILVFDNNFVPRDATRYPRWRYRHSFGPPSEKRGFAPPPASGWKPEGTAFVHEPLSLAEDNEQVDWLEYRHWNPDMGRYGPVYDFCAYNGAGDMRAENTVGDLMLEAMLSVRPDVKSVILRFHGAGDRFQVTIPVDNQGTLEVRRNGRVVAVTGIQSGLLPSSPAESPRKVKLEASVMDRRLTVALGGKLLFAPFDYNDPMGALGPFASPLGVGVIGGGMELSNVRIFRDVYYTSALANSPRRPFGVDTPYQLGKGEFFVLGDNSPVSNDSRFWPGSPVVRSDLFLGKPFLVHLPSQGIPLQVFGRELYWIPDPREIRYIR